MFNIKFVPLCKAGNPLTILNKIIRNIQYIQNFKLND